MKPFDTPSSSSRPSDLSPSFYYTPPSPNSQTIAFPQSGTLPSELEDRFGQLAVVHTSHVASPPLGPASAWSPTPAAPQSYATQGHAAVPQEALQGEVAQRLLSSRLFTATQGLSTEHRRPFTVSVPMGPVSVGVGLDVCRLNTTHVRLESPDRNDPQAPCFLVYEGQTQRGVLVGFGASSAGVGITAYGGGRRGTDVAFRRRVDHPAHRHLLRTAEWDARTAKDDPLLAPWFRVPDVKEHEQFAVGDMWEQTALSQVQGGLLVGHIAQKVDFSVTLAGHFIVRAEKIAPDVMRVSVIPLNYKRMRVESGNFLESVSTARDETEGHSATFQFRVDTHEGHRAYLATLDGQLPVIEHASPATTDAPVALLGRESVNETTVRWQVQLLKRNVALTSSTTTGTQWFDGADGRQSIEQSSKEKAKVSWHGVERREWEVYALYNHLADARGQQRRMFREMLLYLHYGLQPAEKTALRRHDGAALAKTRQEQLVHLARSLNTSMPVLNTVQTEGHFAVEVFVALESHHINVLAQKTEQEVADAAWRNHLDKTRAKEVAEGFTDIRALEQRQRQQEQQLAERFRQLGQPDVLSQNPAMQSEWDALEVETTAKQAPVLATLLRKPDALSLVMYLLRQPSTHAANALPSATDGAFASAPPLRVTHAIDCAAYEDADAVLRDIPELEHFVADGDTQSEADRRQLAAALSRVREATGVLSKALSTAASDPLSAHWEEDMWRTRQARWREALTDVRDLGSFAALQLRADRGAPLLQYDELYRAAPLTQIVPLLLSHWSELEQVTSKQADSLAKLLDDCLEDIHDKLEACDEELKREHAARYLVRHQGLQWIRLVQEVEQHAEAARHSKIRRQLKQMSEFLGDRAIEHYSVAAPGDWQDRPLADNPLDGFRLTA